MFAKTAGLTSESKPNDELNVVGIEENLFKSASRAMEAGNVESGQYIEKEDKRVNTEFTWEEIANGTSFEVSGDYPKIEHSPFAPVSINFELSHNPLAREPWLIDLCADIENLGALPDNYDGENSRKIFRENIEAAKFLVVYLYDQRGFRCSGAFPTADGGIELEIESKFWESAITIENTEKVEYLVKIGGKVKSGTALLEDIPDKIWEAIG
ncbi:MAG: hypothetical protein IIC64_03590 [SAR324 cluster bacterium]|nr:hypothetical protein [SAR324 cluster bacterium]